ncbi:MAG: lipopolysaccharide assembly protein LapA domain-containing protein [Methylococcales bacterium]
MNKILYFSLFGAIFLIALVFSVQNLDPVKVYFYRGAGKELAFEMPLALVLTLELLAGVVIGYSVRMVGYLQLKAENSRLKRLLQMNTPGGPASDR